MISLLEKLKEQQNFKEFNIDSLKDVTEISVSVADIMNQYYKKNDMIYKFIYKVYDVNGEPHLFIKKENKTNLNDSPYDNRYGMDNWVRGLYKLKDKFSDYLLDNLYPFFTDNASHCILHLSLYYLRIIHNSIQYGFQGIAFFFCRCKDFKKNWSF